MTDIVLDMSLGTLIKAKLFPSFPIIVTDNKITFNDFYKRKIKLYNYDLDKIIEEFIYEKYSSFHFYLSSFVYFGETIDLIEANKYLSRMEAATELIQLYVKIKYDVNKKSKNIVILDYSRNSINYKTRPDADYLIQWMKDEGIIDDTFLIQHMFLNSYDARSNNDVKRNLKLWLENNIILNSDHISTEFERVIFSVQKEVNKRITSFHEKMI